MRILPSPQRLVVLSLAFIASTQTGRAQENSPILETVAPDGARLVAVPVEVTQTDSQTLRLKPLANWDGPAYPHTSVSVKLSTQQIVSGLVGVGIYRDFDGHTRMVGASVSVEPGINGGKINATVMGAGSRRTGATPYALSLSGTVYRTWDEDDSYWHARNPEPAWETYVGPQIDFNVSLLRAGVSYLWRVSESDVARKNILVLGFGIGTP